MKNIESPSTGGTGYQPWYALITPARNRFYHQSTSDVSFVSHCYFNHVFKFHY